MINILIDRELGKQIKCLLKVLTLQQCWMIMKNR